MTELAESENRIVALARIDKSIIKIKKPQQFFR